MAAALCTTLVAQVEPTPTPNPDHGSADDAGGGARVGSLSHHDKAFLKKAAKAGMKEVAVSQAVMDRLTNPQVRSFAMMMISDHTAANNELASLLASKGLELPAPDSDLASDWSKMTDKADSKYVKEMLADHEDAVKLFEGLPEQGPRHRCVCPEDALPTLEHHLKLVQDLDKVVD